MKSTLSMKMPYKLVLALIVAALNIGHTVANISCCDVDHDSPNISDRNPVVGTVIGANDWTTFSAAVSDNCGLEKFHINVYGYALSGYQSRATPSCSPGYYCLDYSFPTSGQNWYSVEATDSCGLKRTLGNSIFCVESCPRNLRSSSSKMGSSAINVLENRIK